MPASLSDNQRVTTSSVRTIGARTFDFSRQVAVMAIVNRTRDSFFDQGATFDFAPALDAVDRAVAQGADWVDIGGVPFSPNAQRGVGAGRGRAGRAAGRRRP